MARKPITRVNDYVLSNLSAGYPFREIAAEFDVSISTVKALTAKEPR